MKIVIASGKGGTGKTTLATNLVYVAARQGRDAAYVDCDVEEPNGHIFLKPQISVSKPVGILVPEVDDDKCTHCGACGDICQYSAIVCIGEKVLVYGDLCHGCGGCTLVCPTGAITEVMRNIGVVESGSSGEIKFVHGLLNIGQVMSPPLIRGTKETTPDADIVVYDAPPGTSCPVIEAVRGNDYVVLVTEPTPFGLNDLKLAVAMVRALELPFGVVINRAGQGDDRVDDYCRDENIEVLERIADDRRIAEAYSRGKMIAEEFADLHDRFAALLAAIERKALS